MTQNSPENTAHLTWADKHWVFSIGKFWIGFNEWFDKTDCRGNVYPEDTKDKAPAAHEGKYRPI